MQRVLAEAGEDDVLVGATFLPQRRDGNPGTAALPPRGGAAILAAMPPRRHAPRTAIRFGLALLAGSAVAAQAQTVPPALADAALERFITDGAHRGCDLGDFRAVHRGPLAGIEGLVVVATYGIEGCAGGNNSAQLLGVFRLRDGAVELIRPPLAKPLSVETARLQDGRIIVEGLRWSPEDARCCPSVPVTLAFRLRDGALVADQAPQ